jgi:phosphate:Na+ symporter
VLDRPRLAFASATRELLKMGETVEAMFAPVAALLDRADIAEVVRLRALDDQVNWRHSGIKLYLAEAMRGPLEAADATRGRALTDFAINLEHAGDIIAKTLLSLAEEKADAGLAFSREGRAEIAELHARVAANLQLALGVLLSDDLVSARQLVREKEAIRRLERESHDSHFDRLRSGRAESIETSNLHLEVVRALKEINSLFATAAYPLLTESGEMRESRLVHPA